MKLYIYFLTIIFITISSMTLESGLSLQDLPKDMKAQIILAITQSDDLDEAIDTIRALSETNKEFNHLINDRYITNIIIKLLSNRSFKDPQSNEYFTFNPVTIALALRTPGSFAWLMDEQNNDIVAKIVTGDYKERLINRALETQDFRLITFLIHTDPTLKQKIFLLAVIFDNQDIIKGMIDIGADVNAQEPLSDNSALILASYALNANLVKLFLDNGADVNIQNKEGNTPLLAALTRLQYERQPSVSKKEIHDIITLLAKHKNADLEKVNTYGFTALDLAQSLDDQQIIQILLEAGAQK